MPIPNDITKNDSIKHIYETLNEALAVLREYEGNLDYKARGNSYYEDFSSGWTGTRFKVYWNGLLRSYTTNPPGGRSLLASHQDSYLEFDSFTTEPSGSGLDTLATFVPNDFDSDAHQMGAILAPGVGFSDEGEGLSVEIRFRLHATSTNTVYTVGLFGADNAYDNPLIEGAFEDTAPTHENFIGMWFTKELSHTNWRKYRNNGGVNSDDTAMTAPIDTDMHTVKFEKLNGEGFFTVYFDGVSQGTLSTNDGIYGPYALGFISGGTSHTGFDVDYVKIDHDLSGSSGVRP